MIKLLLLLLAVNFSLTSCQKEKPLINNDTNTETSSQNLIKNSSFEINGQATNQNWTGPAYFSQETPLGGGQWSLQLIAGASLDPGSNQIATTYITGQTGSWIYNLKVWAKCMGTQGMVSMRVLSNNQYNTYKLISACDTISWEEYVLSDTITTQLTDTIAVDLVSGFGNANPFEISILFDLVQLEKLPQ